MKRKQTARENKAPQVPAGNQNTPKPAPEEPTNRPPDIGPGHVIPVRPYPEQVMKR